MVSLWLLLRVIIVLKGLIYLEFVKSMNFKLLPDDLILFL